MQYLLTAEEYSSLALLAGRGRQLPDDENLQKLCTQIADEMPIEMDWCDDKKPWGCILTKNDEDWDCDDCPVQVICPHPDKRWSK